MNTSKICVDKVIERFSNDNVFNDYTIYVMLTSAASRWLQLDLADIKIQVKPDIESDIKNLPHYIDGDSKEVISTAFDCLATVVYAVNGGDRWVIDGENRNEKLNEWEVDLQRASEFIEKFCKENRNISIIEMFFNLLQLGDNKRDKMSQYLENKCRGTIKFVGIAEKEEWDLMKNWNFWASTAMELFGWKSNKDRIWRVSSRLEGGREKNYHRGRNMKTVKGLLTAGQKAHRRDIIYGVARYIKGVYKPRAPRGTRKRKNDSSGCCDESTSSDADVSSLSDQEFKLNDRAWKLPRSKIVYDYPSTAEPHMLSRRHVCPEPHILEELRCSGSYLVRCVETFFYVPCCESQTVSVPVENAAALHDIENGGISATNLDYDSSSSDVNRTGADPAHNFDPDTLAVLQSIFSEN